MAEDARVLTLRKKEQEREEAARRAQEEAREKAQAEADAAQKQAQDAQARADEDARRRAEAEKAKADADLQRSQALLAQQQAMAQAQAAQQAAEDAERQKQEAQTQAQEADREKQEAIQQKEELRARLLAQLNQVLQTRDSARGLIVSMPDVLFAFNKYNLKPEARERLAKVSGILLAYPDLKLGVEGHTDSIGSDEYNQQLSEKRADSVRGYLVSEGVKPDTVTATGLGKADPVADNSTAAGRQLNRRVDIIVSGDVIGTQLTPSIVPEGTGGNQ